MPKSEFFLNSKMMYFFHTVVTVVVVVVDGGCRNSNSHGELKPIFTTIII